MQEENLVSIDKRIQGLVQRHKSVKGKTPAHNKNKERIRDNIESLRNKRNSITGNPKSEPVEATDPYAIQQEDFAPKVAKERRTKASNEIDKHIKRIQDILDIESDKPHASHYKKSIEAMKSAQDHLDHEHYVSDMEEEFTVAQRQRKAIVMRRNKAKLSVGRRRASSRIADRERLLKRAKRRARKMIAKKLTRGQDNLSAARKSQIEKRLSKMSSKVERIQKRILPTVRKDDRGM